MSGCWLEVEPVIECMRPIPNYINVFSTGDIHLMSSIRVFTISSALIALCLTFGAFAQNNNSAGNDGKSGGQVEVKTDRFSGDVTVTMKPQTLIDTPELQLTMELDYELNKKKLEESPVLVEEIASVTLKSSVKDSVDYGDRELHFLVDGARLPGRRTSSNVVNPLLSEEDDKGRTPNFTFFSTLDLSQVERLAAGKKVEMRLGPIETALSPATLAAIRDFAREFAAHAPTRSNRKGAKR
jgi:hypothetical protein